MLDSRNHRDKEEGSIPYSSVVSAPLRLFWIVWNKTFKVGFGEVKGSLHLPRTPELLTISNLTAACLYLPRLVIPPWLWQSQASQDFPWHGSSAVMEERIWGEEEGRREGVSSVVGDPWPSSENYIFTLKSKTNCPPSVCAGSRSFRKIIKLPDIWEQREQLGFDLSVSFTVSPTSILNSFRITCEFTSSVTLRWCRLAQAIFLN